MNEIVRLRQHLETLSTGNRSDLADVLLPTLLMVAEAAEATAAWSRWPAPTPLERMVDHRVAEKALLSSTEALNVKISELLREK